MGLPSEPVIVTITADDRKLLLDHAILLEPLFSRLSDAATSADTVMLDMSAVDLDELLGYVAAAANHASSRSLARRFDELYERLETYE